MTEVPGISGLAAYVPPFRVDLQAWCEWYGQSWDKVGGVVGHGFRTKGPHESVYTMAANAVWRLLQQYEVDPEKVGFLALGTESSTDNAAGAVIVRGMVDQALVHQGLPPLARDLEVPEFKHACLGGVYGIKAAQRYLMSDGRDRVAIVVCADIAEYERGSTGEQTQGAGAVALLLEPQPRLCRLRLDWAGSSSAYRGLDFRKPFARHAVADYTPQVQRQHDFPVFNGKYSTYCYLDAVTEAARAMFAKMEAAPLACLEKAHTVLLHRPYHWMPRQAFAALYVWALTQSTSSRKALGALCAEAGVEIDAVLAEAHAQEDLFDKAQRAGLDTHPTPALNRLAKGVRDDPTFGVLQNSRLALGSETMMHLGNLYTAALPAWLAAAFEQAAGESTDLAGALWLTLGYGSGDAAEAIPLEVVEGWREAAALIALSGSLDAPVDLTQSQYESLHDGRPVHDLAYTPRDEFVVDRVGDKVAGAGQDVGIEYYRYVPAASPPRQRVA